MNKGRFQKFIGEGSIVIPLYMLKLFKKLNLTMDEFVFLMYLYNKQDSLDFNPEKIADDMNLDIMEVMGYVSVLTDKGYINLDVKKAENNILEEIINLDSFYDKISTFLINSEESSKEDNAVDILSYVEKELGRPLNSVEVKTINGWLDSNIKGELIKEAVSIAIASGVYTLKFIDRILIDWVEKGIRTLDDLKKNEEPNKGEEGSTDLDTLDWDWWNDDEEYIEN